MPENYTCAKCGKVAKTKQALERHAAYHEDDRPFSCEVCLQRFKNSDDRGKHYRRLKRDGKFHLACQVCHKHFKSQELLSKHLEILGCLLKQTKPEGSLGIVSEHMEVSSNGGRRNCSITGGSLDTLTLNNQIKCTCKICECEFIGTDTLKKHYRDVHTDTKRQVCIQCGQTLSSKDSLARHYSIFHQNNYPFQCDLCEQKFKIKESLCRHIKFVHKDGGYPCDICQRVFSQPVNLKKHMAMHSTSKDFSCKICGREFRWKQALQKHVMLHETAPSGLKAQGLASQNDTTDNTDILRNGACFEDSKTTQQGNIRPTQSRPDFDFHEEIGSNEKVLPRSGQFYQTCSNRFMSTMNEGYCTQINFESSSKRDFRSGKRQLDIDRSTVNTNVSGQSSQFFASPEGNSDSVEQRNTDLPAERQMNEHNHLNWTDTQREDSHETLQRRNLHRRDQTELRMARHMSDGNLNLSNEQERGYDRGTYGHNAQQGHRAHFRQNNNLTEGSTGDSYLKDLANIITSYANKNETNMNQQHGVELERVREFDHVDMPHRRSCEFDEAGRTKYECLNKGQSAGTGYFKSVGEFSGDMKTRSQSESELMELDQGPAKSVVNYKRRHTLQSIHENSEVSGIKRSRTYDERMNDGYDTYVNNNDEDEIGLEMNQKRSYSSTGARQMGHRGKNGAGNENNRESDRAINRKRKNDSDGDNTETDDDFEETETNKEGKDVKVNDSSFTSRPTHTEKNAPIMIFKPSSIQRILTRSKRRTGKMDCDEWSESSDDENIKPETNVATENTTNQVKVQYQVVDSSTIRKLHNPFLIKPFSPSKESNTETNNKVKQTIESRHRQSSKKHLNDETQVTSNMKEKHLPEIRGPYKFSLVKHMLSLQNEDNFDKAIFVNPLYSGPADVQGLENLVQRHKVEDTDGYDLSAKQGIPFQWLGMKVRKKPKAVTNDENDDIDQNGEKANTMENTCENEFVEHESFRKSRSIQCSKSEVEHNVGFPCQFKSEVVSTSVPTSKSKVELAAEINNSFQQSDGQALSGLKIMMDLVQRSKYSDKAPDSVNKMKSVLRNPFATQGDSNIIDIASAGNNFDSDGESNSDMEQTRRPLAKCTRSFSTGHSLHESDHLEVLSERESVVECLTDEGVLLVKAKQSLSRSFSIDSRLKVPSRETFDLDSDERNTSPDSIQQSEEVDGQKSFMLGHKQHSSAPCVMDFGQYPCPPNVNIEISEDRNDGYDSSEEKIDNGVMNVRFDLANESESNSEVDIEMQRRMENMSQMENDQNSILMLFNKNLSQLNRLKVVPDILQSSRERILSAKSSKKQCEYPKTAAKKNVDLSENIAQELNNVLCSSLQNEHCLPVYFETNEPVEDRGTCFTAMKNSPNDLGLGKPSSRLRSVSADVAFAKPNGFEIYGRTSNVNSNVNRNDLLMENQDIKMIGKDKTYNKNIMLTGEKAVLNIPRKRAYSVDMHGTSDYFNPNGNDRVSRGKGNRDIGNEDTSVSIENKQRNAYNNSSGKRIRESGYGTPGGKDLRETGYESTGGKGIRETGYETTIGKGVRENSYKTASVKGIRESGYESTSGKSIRENNYETASGKGIRESSYATVSGKGIRENSYKTTSGKGIRENSYETASGKGIRESSYKTATGKGTRENSYETVSGKGIRENSYETVSGKGIRESGYESTSGKGIRESVYSVSRGKGIRETGFGNYSQRKGLRDNENEDSPVDRDDVSIYDILRPQDDRDKEYETIDKLLYTYF